MIFARLLILICLLLSLSLPAWAQSVRNIRLGQNGQTTRVVLDVDENFAVDSFTLANPYRLVLDLPKVRWDVDAAQGAQGKGLVERYRFGLFRPDVSRVVLDMAGPFEVVRLFSLPAKAEQGPRIVMDLAPISANDFKAKAAERRSEHPQQDYAVRAPAEPKPDDGRRTIVIDAGHGGVDPGTSSARGVPEKQVVLAIARAIRNRLARNPRYRVEMTRDEDIFIDLRERIAIARSYDADLFLSIHADALGNRSVRGATVYTLSEQASDAEAAALARKENKADLIAGVDLSSAEGIVTNILIDLAQRETMNFSARFANYLVEELGQRHVLRKNSHRFAGFIVLKAPDVPSILLETGYLSNARDAAWLQSDAGQQSIAVSVEQAVAQYFEAVRAADL